MASVAERVERRIVPPRRPPAEPTGYGGEGGGGLGLTHGMWGVVIFIASEVMFFAALFTSYFYLRAQNPEWHPTYGERPIVWPWHAAEGAAFPADAIVTFNTVILVSSSFVIQWGMTRLKHGDRGSYIRALVATMILGVLFLSGQAFEYTRLFGEEFTPRAGIVGGIFFGLTGFHGAHVSGGVLFFIVILVRALAGQFDAHRHLAAEAASIYWHFVDVVWIGLYMTLYIL